MRIPNLFLSAICVFVTSSLCNAQGGQEPKITPFAENVVLHVVLHELGHGLVREFDLPILGNEETLADAFATCYLTRYLPDQAFDVLKARITSWTIEANEVARDEWTVKGEHNSDARRAYQVAALAIAADPEKYAPLGKLVGMSESQMRGAADYGAEIHRSWRRLLRPLMMPAGQQSKEVSLRFDPSGELVSSVRNSKLIGHIETALRRFDWHSQITVSFIQGDGGAGWNRSKRAITVYTEYMRRFIRQGQQAASKR